MDANAGHNDPEINDLMADTGLVNALLHRHPTTTPLPTYNRGHKTLDIVLACVKALPYIKKVGILAFYQLIPSDHRALFLDIYEKMLQALNSDTTKITFHVPSLLKPSTAHAFIERYKMLLTKAKLFEKVKEISTRLESASQTEKLFLIQRLNKYDKAWVELLKSATKQLRKPAGTKPWSPILAKVGGLVRYWNSCIRTYHQTGILDQNNFVFPYDEPPPPVDTIEQALAHRDDAVVTWHETKGNAADIRQSHLEDRVDAYAAKHEIKRESAVKQILHSEETRALHKKQRFIMKPADNSQLTSLVIPSPNSKNPDATMEISDPTQILEILLRRNKRKLSAAHNGYFNHGHLRETVGDYAETPEAQQLLNGTFELDKVDEWTEYPHKDVLKTFLKNIKRPSDTNGDPIPDMQWTYGAAEFRATFSKKSEHTACGPSGVTMPYYKIFCEDDELSEFHATFIRLPFKYGFSLERWQQSIQFMLLKLEVPLWEKLRIIQLMEGDFNGGLRYIFATKMMTYADVKGTSSDFTYGGRHGRNCHDALLRIQLFNEYHRILRKPAANIDIDAEACYDRQLRNSISLCTRSIGAPKEAAECQIRTLEKMKHRVKTALGISSQYIQHSTDTLMYGSGQGSGAGGTNWHAHNEVIFRTYQEAHPPFQMIGPDPSKQVSQSGISFVDDNTLLHSFPFDAEFIDMIKKCAESLFTWQTCMTITGGRLTPEKCNLSLLRYNFDTFEYHKTKSFLGIPRICTTQDITEECIMESENGAGPIAIKQIEPTKGHRLLGVRLALDGNFNDELKFRKNQARQMAGCLANSSATPQDAYMIYSFRYCPAVLYCTPITYFSKPQCEAIQRPFINALLPKLRINRHIKRAIVWGPLLYGGLGLKDMATEQLVSTIHKTVGHVRAATSVGQTFLITVDAYQLYLGSAKPFFQQNPSSFPHRQDCSHSKLTYMWESLHSLDMTLMLANQWVPKITRKHDMAIIDAVIQVQKDNAGTSTFISNQQIVYANACRLWLRVTLLSEITNDNNSINPVYFHGLQQYETTLEYPYQPKPPPQVWQAWKSILHQCFVSNQHIQMPNIPLFRPLGQTIQPESHFTWSAKPHLRGKSIQQIYSSLPQHWQSIIAPIEWPDDDGRTLYGDINQDLDPPCAYPDGTVSNGAGAHAYTIQPKNNESSKCITGAGRSPGDPSVINSLRTEHYGGICILIWVWILEQRYGPSPSGRIHIHIDNDTVVKRLKQGIPTDDSVNAFIATDYDLWAESTTIMSNIQCTPSFFHVKGHQDDFRIKHRKQGPLPQHAFWNVEMDKLAGLARRNPDPPPVHFLPSSKIAIQTRQSTITTKIDQSIRDAVAAAPLQEYICDKEGWSPETFDLVDWNAMYRALKGLGLQKRINATKYMFDWQNTGAQKQRFEIGYARREQREAVRVNTCPLECGCIEEAQHFLHCPVLHEARIADIGLQSLYKWFATTKTHHHIKNSIILAVKDWITSKEVPLVWDVPNELQEWGLHTALAEQNSIGWNNFFKGRISKQFGLTQMEAYQQDLEVIPSHYSATWWTAGLIKQMIYFSLNMWQHRNSYLHETEATRQALQDRREAIEEAAYWYDNSHKFPSTDQVHFQRTFLERCTDTTKQVRLWLQKISDLYEYNARRTLQDFFT